jgi:hypothetical protein
MREAARPRAPPHAARLPLGANHSIFVSPSRRTSTVPRHAELNDDLAKKICKDLGIPPA